MAQIKGPMGRKVHRDSDSFADDKIGAKKAKKEQEKKAQKELGAKTRQAELARRAERVKETTSALEDLRKVPAAHQHEPGKGLQGISTRGQKTSDTRSALTDASVELQKMTDVFSELEVLISAILSDMETEEAADPNPAQRDDTVALQRRAAQILSSHAELEGKVEPEVLARLKDLDSSLNRARDEFRGLIQFAMSGEFGASLKDPYLQFEPLFNAVDAWPAIVPPGRTCSDASSWEPADWDAFLAWVYAPPACPPDLTDLWSS